MDGEVEYKSHLRHQGLLPCQYHVFHKVSILVDISEGIDVGGCKDGDTYP